MWKPVYIEVYGVLKRLDLSVKTGFLLKPTGWRKTGFSIVVTGFLDPIGFKEKPGFCIKAYKIEKPDSYFGTEVVQR